MKGESANQLVSMSKPSTTVEIAGWLAILATAAEIVLLASLHLLSPEFSPSWRMISEYAFGHYAWVLSLMFAASGIGSWALAIAIWSRVRKSGFVVPDDLRCWRCDGFRI
jgi:hypothetical protein